MKYTNFNWKRIPYKLIFLKRSLKNYMNIELYNGKTSGSERKVLGKWSPLMNDNIFVNLTRETNTGELGYDGLNGTRKIGPSYAKSVIYI